jgi:AAA domain-containing protein
LAKPENALLLVQDEFLDALFPGEITDLAGFLRCSSRLRSALAQHVCDLLLRGISVVLDFPGNTKAQRVWFRELILNMDCTLLDAPDALCKVSLRSEARADLLTLPWTTEAEFAAITMYFQPAPEDEHFNVARHERA